MINFLFFISSFFMMSNGIAGAPLWTFTPFTATTLSVPSNSTATVQYQVTNQSSKPHTLIMQPIQAITQTTTGLGICGNPFVLQGKGSCVLSFQIDGSQLTSPISDGPIVCQQGNPNQCYRPSAEDILHITQAPPLIDAVISLSDSPLTLTVNGSTGQLIIHNNSATVTATNVTSNFTGTALDGNVIETGNTCTNVPPSGSCTLTYTPGGTIVPETNFSIQGSNTNTLTAAIAIQSGSTLDSVAPDSGSASGNAGVILTGTGLTGATSVTFDGIAATSVDVVNSTTVNAVTPAHTVGTVDVVITTPAGGATLTNGYTYVTTAVGQSAGGGVIACLNGGSNNLIAASSDNSTNILWGTNTAIGVSAQSTTDGAANTSAIVAELTGNQGQPETSYAAGICSLYQVDSQSNSPCAPGNTCYSDWFLPAGNNASSSGQLNCLFTNATAIGGFGSVPYWSSTEFSSSPTTSAWGQDFNGGAQSILNKSDTYRVRCVRAFTP